MPRPYFDTAEGKWDISHVIKEGDYIEMDWQKKGSILGIIISVNSHGSGGAMCEMKVFACEDERLHRKWSGCNLDPVHFCTAKVCKVPAGDGIHVPKWRPITRPEMLRSKLGKAHANEIKDILEEMDDEDLERSTEAAISRKPPVSAGGRSPKASRSERFLDRKRNNGAADSDGDDEEEDGKSDKGKTKKVKKDKEKSKGKEKLLMALKGGRKPESVTAALEMIKGGKISKTDMKELRKALSGEKDSSSDTDEEADSESDADPLLTVLAATKEDTQTPAEMIESHPGKIFTELVEKSAKAFDGKSGFRPIMRSYTVSYGAKFLSGAGQARSLVEMTTIGASLDHQITFLNEMEGSLGKKEAKRGAMKEVWRGCDVMACRWRAIQTAESLIRGAKGKEKVDPSSAWALVKHLEAENEEELAVSTAELDRIRKRRKLELGGKVT